MCERYQSLSKEEKKKQQCDCEQYKNLAEDEKQNLVGCSKNLKFIKNAFL